jgi:hypothetical protein
MKETVGAVSNLDIAAQTALRGSEGLKEAWEITSTITTNLEYRLAVQVNHKLRRLGPR